MQQIESFMRSFSAIFVVALTAVSWATPTDHIRKPKPAPELTPVRMQAVLAEIDRSIPGMLGDAHVPGMWLTVVKDGKVVLLKGYGYRNVEKHLAMTPDTVTCIASCSKAFTSTLVLMAVQDGKLSLDDPVRKFLPSFHLKDPEADAGMTVADLMCHSSGLTRTDIGWQSQSLDEDECIKMLADCDPTYKFRENAQYSNILVDTASKVAATAYGEPIAQLLHDKVAGQLDMTSTAIEASSSVDKDRMCVGYWFDPLTGQLERERYDDAPCIPGAGGVKSTARDMSHWLLFHLNGGTYGGKSLIRPEVLSLAYQPRQVDVDGVSFGLGWVVDSRWPKPIVWHNGALDGFNSMVCLVPSEHLGFAFSLNNLDAGQEGPITGMILRKLIGAPDPTWEHQPGKEAAVYVDKAADHVYRISYDGSLWATLDQDGPIRLERRGWRTYATADSREKQLTVVFSDDPLDKKSTVATIAIGGETVVCRKSVKWEPGITVKELMRRSIAANGGEAALKDSASLTGRYHSVLRQEGLTSQGLLVRTGEDIGFLDRIYYRDKFLTNILGSNNSDWGGWTEDHERAFLALGAGNLDARLLNSPCLALDWKSRFRKVEIIAKVKLHGEECYVAKLTPKDSPSKILEFISAATGLTLRRESDNPPNVMEFSDYRPFHNLVLPYRLVSIDQGLHEQDYTISDYTVLNRYPHWAYYPLGSSEPPSDK